MQNSFSLEDKVALITGASRGIGKAIAETLAQSGATVIINSRKEEAVQVVVDELQAKGLKAIGKPYNVSKEEETKQLVQEVIQEQGQLDILVNNAGTSLGTGFMLDADTAIFDKMMNVNVKSAFWLSQAAYPQMKKQGKASIINIASIEGIQPSPDLGIYSLTKAALIMMTKSLAKELGKDSIRVNAICPGYIYTKLSAAKMGDLEEKAKIIKKQALPYEGQVEDIANLALYLASDAGAFCTGSIFTADGGFTL